MGPKGTQLWRDIEAAKGNSDRALQLIQQFNDSISADARWYASHDVFMVDEIILKNASKGLEAVFAHNELTPEQAQRLVKSWNEFWFAFDDAMGTGTSKALDTLDEFKNKLREQS